MNYDDIRKTFLNFFERKGHKIFPSASLIPNDPDLLFTIAGMVPWKNVLQGTAPAPAPRIADVQKCLRAGGKHNDLEEVGFDGRHHTFFEMMGNWSFGDYFKQEAIEMSWELLTKTLEINPKKLRVVTHISDDESTEIWRKVAGKTAIRRDKDNWWSVGDTGLCGPCTEIFYDFGANIKSEDDRWIEIWNNVFMQYDRDADGKLIPLPKKNVDTGAGLERWAAMLQGKTDDYETDLFEHLIHAAEDIVGVKKTEKNAYSFKIIVDHLRAISFAIADGVVPSNTERGYVIRRILRRGMRQGQILGHKGALFSRLYPALITEMGHAYPELVREKSRVIETIQNEENSFADMLQSGVKVLENELPKINNGVLPGAVAFKLFDTYGFPLDLTQMILRDKGMSVDTAGFEKAMREQRERSRADTKGTRILWESQTKLIPTDDAAKYAPDQNLKSQVLSILHAGKFVKSAKKNDEVEVALDKTNFYGTQGGQIGDTGELMKNGETVMKVGEALRAGNLVIHKGTLTGDLSVGDIVVPKINESLRQQIARAHTAVHLLQAALRTVLNENVEQRGSKVSPDSVRFDFSFGRAMTEEEKRKTEDLINKWIDMALPVVHEEMPLSDAKKRGALALFSEKYGDIVKVITVGNLSCELCGGTHIYNTKEIIHAKINKEKSISSGVRRITMSVGNLAEK